MKKIVILGASGLKNTGDEALLESLLSKFRSSEYQITVISFDPAYTEKLHKVSSVGFGGKDWKQAVHDCDLFIMGGGGLLQDETTVFNVYRWLSKLYYAVKQGKKTYVYANSIGPLKYFINRRLVKYVLSQVDCISLRDRWSADLLIELGLDDEKIHVTTDPVFGLNCNNLEDPSKLLTAAGVCGNYVVVCLRHWFDAHPVIPVKYCTKFNIRTKQNRHKYNSFVSEMAQLVEHLNNEHALPVVFLSFCHQRDSLIAKDILNKVNSSLANIVIDNLSYVHRTYLSIIKNSEFVIGMRLHALVFSILMKKLFVALSYSTKNEALLEWANLQDLGIDVEAFSASKGISLLAKHILSGDSDTLLGRIETLSAEAKEAEQQNVVLAKNLLGS